MIALFNKYNNKTIHYRFNNEYKLISFDIQWVLNLISPEIAVASQIFITIFGLFLILISVYQKGLIKRVRELPIEGEENNISGKWISQNLTEESKFHLRKKMRSFADDRSIISGPLMGILMVIIAFVIVFVFLIAFESIGWPLLLVVISFLFIFKNSEQLDSFRFIRYLTAHFDTIPKEDVEFTEITISQTNILSRKLLIFGVLCALAGAFYNIAPDAISAVIVAFYYISAMLPSQYVPENLKMLIVAISFILPTIFLYILHRILPDILRRKKIEEREF